MRPTSYNEQVLKDARNYIKNYDTVFGDLVPMVVGLCVAIKRSKATVYSWAKDDDKQEFIDILGEIEEMQHIKLVNGGLSGDFTSPITKMMMTKHGYSDKQEIEVTETDVTPWAGLASNVDE